jgi:dTDP-3-amino-3,4,6-trideoxy-alpha-D-glucose transaminase
MILQNDFKRQWTDVGSDVLDAVRRVGESGWYILGREVQDFEQALTVSCGLRHAVGVASGLDAIELALKALGCKTGDRVLTTPVSAFATTLAIVKLGAVPVFADVDAYGLIDLTACREALRRRPEIRFFVPVHLYGHALDLRAVSALAEEFDCGVVEDCAQAIGARSEGCPVGTVGALAAISFYPTKNLGALGDGGAVLTGSADHAAAARSLRDYGQSTKYRHTVIGYNSRLDELQAALMSSAHLPRLSAWTERRRQIAGQYVAGIDNPLIRIPGAPEGSESSWHLFPVIVAAERKADFIGHMKLSGVLCGEHYPIAIPDQPAMQTVPCEMADSCERARQWCSSQVSLPIHPYLSDDEVDRVMEAANAWNG